MEVSARSLIGLLTKILMNTYACAFSECRHSYPIANLSITLLSSSKYGYWRDSDGTCVVNPHVPSLDICDLVDLEFAHDLFQMVGYFKVPGTRCQGGWEPPHSNLTFDELTSHCHSKFNPSFGLSRKALMFIIALIVILTIIGAVLYCRHRRDTSTVLRQHRRVPDVFRRFFQHSRLVTNHKEFKVAPNAVFFASGDNGVLKTSSGPLSSGSHSYLVPQITHFGANRQKAEDRLDLLENEELCEEDESSTTNIISANSNNDQGQHDVQDRMDHLLF